MIIQESSDEGVDDETMFKLDAGLAAAFKAIAGKSANKVSEEEGGDDVGRRPIRQGQPKQSSVFTICSRSHFLINRETV